MGLSAQSAGATNPMNTLAAYNMFLPMLSKKTIAEIPAFSNAITQATASATPILNQLNFDHTKLAVLQSHSQSVLHEEQTFVAGTNLMQLNGAGGDAARSAVALNKELNPEYYTAMDAASRGAASAVNAINLNGLSPGEAAAVERSLNQTNTAIVS